MKRRFKVAIGSWVAVCAMALAAPASAQTRTPWQMNFGVGVTDEYSGAQNNVAFSCTPGYHGDPCEYNVAVVPSSTDGGWIGAPNGDSIGFFHPCGPTGSVVCQAPVTCMRYGDFTYFQTLVDVPANTTVTTFTIAFSDMDDGSRVSIYNSKYPSGLVIPGSYVFLGGTGTTNLAPYVVAGETNRVVVTQVDDCCCANNLGSAQVVLNGVYVPPVDPCAHVTCPQCQVCSNGSCVGDATKNGTSCNGSADGVCYVDQCNNGTCSAVATHVPDMTITCDPNQTIECTGNKSATATFGATAKDSCGDGILSESCPGSGTSFGLGTSSSQCSASDPDGHTASCSIGITVVDTKAPTISTTNQTITTSSQNGACTAQTNPGATGVDVCEGNLIGSCSPSTLSLSGPGTTSASCSVADSSGNAATGTATLTLVDDTAPTITVGATTVVGNCTGAALTLDVSATDNCGAATLACTTIAGTSFGSNTVTCDAVDGSNNRSSTTFTLVVLEPLHVVFQSPLADDNTADDPTTDADAVNRFQVGSVIPHKVYLYDCAGATVTAGVTAHINVTENQGASDTLVQDVAETYTGVGDAGSVMALVDSHFQYNLDTSGYQSGTIYDSLFYQSLVTITYDSAPSVVVGQEDARLESK